eukprot:3935395-Rhodomonas_salina.1
MSVRASSRKHRTPELVPEAAQRMRMRMGRGYLKVDLEEHRNLTAPCAPSAPDMAPRACVRRHGSSPDWECP